MKKFLTAASFLFVLLLAVLPAQASQAFAAENTSLTGITLVTDHGEIQTTGSGDHFNVNLGNVPGDWKVKQVIVEASDNAVLLGSDTYGITVHLVNGKTVQDKASLDAWLSKPENADFSKVYSAILSKYQGTDTIVSIQDLRDLFSNGDVEEGYLADADGNQSPFTVTFYTASWDLRNGQWYYINDQADLAKGWLKYNNQWYFLDTYTGAMRTGWALVNGKWYYMDPAKDGVMQTGWLPYNGHWYYLNGDGDMATGWAFVNGKWYYMNPYNDGIMQTGWLLYGGNWYYLTGNGDMATGWVLYGGKWYYLNGNGDMATGWVLSGNKWYYLYSDGHMAANTYVGPYRLGPDGAWIH